MFWNGSITGDISWGWAIVRGGLLGFKWQVIGMIGFAGKNKVDTCITPVFYTTQKRVSRQLSLD